MHPLKLIKIKNPFGFLQSNPEILAERVEPNLVIKNMFSWNTLGKIVIHTYKVFWFSLVNPDLGTLVQWILVNVQCAYSHSKGSLHVHYCVLVLIQYYGFSTFLIVPPLQLRKKTATHLRLGYLMKVKCSLVSPDQANTNIPLHSSNIIVALGKASPEKILPHGHCLDSLF